MSDCRFGVSPVNYPDPDPVCVCVRARVLACNTVVYYYTNGSFNL